MKTRILLGVGLLATLLAIPVIVEAQTKEDMDRLRELSDLRDRWQKEYRFLHAQGDNSIRELAAREEALKAELRQLAEKRTELGQSLERRRQEFQERIDKASAEISALDAKVGAAGTKRDSVEAKLDQILNRLKAMETRLDRLERAVKSPQPQTPMPK